MMYRTLCSLLLSTMSCCTAPAFAETYVWEASSVSFIGQEVVFTNNLSHGAQDFNIDMEDNGVTIRLVLMQDWGKSPDVMYVIPPDGYIAIPETITVEEGEQGTILVVPEGMS